MCIKGKVMLHEVRGVCAGVVILLRFSPCHEYMAPFFLSLQSAREQCSCDCLSVNVAFRFSIDLPQPKLSLIF